MKAVFGMVGLLIALVIVGFVVKKQLASTRQAVPALQVPGSQVPGLPATDSNASVKAHSQQIQQQYKQAIDAAVQSRPMPDDK